MLWGTSLLVDGGIWNFAELFAGTEPDWIDGGGWFHMQGGTQVGILI
jgi:hypothetical protein